VCVPQLLQLPLMHGPACVSCCWSWRSGRCCCCCCCCGGGGGGCWCWRWRSW
jgi:hypothetical protein